MPVIYSATGKPLFELRLPSFSKSKKKPEALPIALIDLHLFVISFIMENWDAFGATRFIKTVLWENAIEIVDKALSSLTIRITIPNEAPMLRTDSSTSLNLCMTLLNRTKPHCPMYLPRISRAQDQVKGGHHNAKDTSVAETLVELKIGNSNHNEFHYAYFAPLGLQDSAQRSKRRTRTAFCVYAAKRFSTSSEDILSGIFGGPPPRATVIEQFDFVFTDTLLGQSVRRNLEVTLRLRECTFSSHAGEDEHEMPK